MGFYKFSDLFIYGYLFKFKKVGEITERYDSIEYGFENSAVPEKNENIQTTEKDGFITSQQYIPDDNNIPKNTDTHGNELIEKEKKKPKDKNATKETVIVFQLAMCIILAIAAYVIKSFGGDFYENVRELYYSNLNNSIIIDIQNDNNDDYIRETINELNSQEG